ncbi:MAG: hypothetical protein AAFO94_06335 [Bacteroidota bacterium]
MVSLNLGYRIKIVTTNKPINVDCNAVHLQNTGNRAVTIDGKLTLAPGATFQFGSQDDINHVKGSMDIQFLDIVFAAYVYDSPRLEVVEMNNVVCKCNRCAQKK